MSSSQKRNERVIRFCCIRECTNEYIARMFTPFNCFETTNSSDLTKKSICVYMGSYIYTHKNRHTFMCTTKTTANGDDIQKTIYFVT